ncbi:MAG: STAS domain-containing protein [Planctomycetota bacterium]|nr:STAS domain-containing protein [Planctomycetota bacterium]
MKRSTSFLSVCKSDGQVLRIEGALLRVHLGPFCEQVAGLANVPSPEVTLDFTGCVYMSSQFIGRLVDGVQEVRRSGKQVRVLLSPELGEFFDRAHLQHLFEYEVVRGTKASLS